MSDLRDVDAQLFAAIKSGNSKKVSDLINDGANVNARDASSRTPLHVAAQRGHNDIAQLLIGAGADVNSYNKHLYMRKVFGAGYAYDHQTEAKVDAALKQAHEIRRFELNLYWQRSVYLGAFILAFFIGFTSLLIAETNTILMAKEGLMKEEGFIWVGLLSIALLGYFTSLAWYHVHEGSRFWQRNWELHIDFLEDSITGRLHKSIFAEVENGEWHDHYSLNKINRSFIVVIILMWIVLTAFATFFFLRQFLPWICQHFEIFEKTNLFYVVVLFGIFIVVSPLILVCRLNGRSQIKLECWYGYWRRHDHDKYEKCSKLSVKGRRGKKIFLYQRKFLEASKLCFREECNCKCNCKECCG